MARATFTRNVGISGPNASRSEITNVEYALANELYENAHRDGYDAIDITITVNADAGTATIIVTGEDADAFADDNK